MTDEIIMSLTTTEAARLLGVHVDTIRRAIKSGALGAFKLGKKGHWRIRREHLEQFLRS